MDSFGQIRAGLSERIWISRFKKVMCKQNTRWFLLQQNVPKSTSRPYSGMISTPNRLNKNLTTWLELTDLSGKSKNEFKFSNKYWKSQSRTPNINIIILLGCRPRITRAPDPRPSRFGQSELRILSFYCLSWIRNERLPGEYYHDSEDS